MTVSASLSPAIRHCRRVARGGLPRAERRRLRGTTFDLAIIGGGISGTSIPRDAAGRGLSVFLCEEGDLAGGATSNGGGVTLNGIPGDIFPRALRGARTEIAEAAMLLRCAPHVARPV